MFIFFLVSFFTNVLFCMEENKEIYEKKIINSQNIQKKYIEQDQNINGDDLLGSQISCESIIIEHKKPEKVNYRRLNSTRKALDKLKNLKTLDRTQKKKKEKLIKYNQKYMNK